MEEEQTHYTPQEKPDRLATREKPPRNSLGLNKRAVLVLLCIGAGVIGLLFLTALSPKEQESHYKANNKWNPHPSEAVQGLPSDYDERQRRKEAEERKVTFQQKLEISPKPLEKRLTPEEKILQEYEISRLKDAIKARDSDLEFRGVNQKLGAGYGMRASLKTEAPESGGYQASNAEGAINPRDDHNRQDEKDSFLNERRLENTHLSSNLIPQASKYELMAGTVIPGLMLTGINSDLPGHIVGQVSQNIFDTVTGRYLLLPQGTKVVGLYDSKVTYGQERVLIVWNRVILPNGKSVSLEGMPGVDMSGYSGLKDKVNNHYLRLLSGVVLGSFLGAGAQVAYGDYQNVNPDFGQLALQGAAQNINQAGQKITQKNLNVQPTLEIRPGLRFSIFVTKDITLEPYREN